MKKTVLFIINLLISLSIFANVNTCFSPDGNCQMWVKDKIDFARSTIKLEGYYLTNPVIIQALIDKRAEGLGVVVILDKTSGNQKAIEQLRSNGIDVYIDRHPRIAHNKVIIIDDKIVLTGSYNWTTNANNYNAENIVEISGYVEDGKNVNTEIINQYLENFELRLSLSEKVK